MSIDFPRTFGDLPATTARFIGQAVNRIEDPALLTGQVEFIDNMSVPGMLHAAFLRSAHAHARITSVDVSEALKLPGVIAVITGEDAVRWSGLGYSVPEGWGTPCLATEKVRFVGEPIAAVAATSRYVAEDAIELIRVEYEPLPAITDAIRSVQPSAPLLFEDKPSNVMYQRTFTWGDVDGAFAQAAHVFTEKFRWHRVGGNPLETFGVIAQWDTVNGTVTCHGSFQVQSPQALATAVALWLPANKVRFISQPHGGSFGGKGGPRATAITALLSRKTGGRPVKYIEDRVEYLIAGGSQSWDRHYEVSLAVKGDGVVTGMKVVLLDDLGANGEGYGAISAAKPLASFTGCYAIPCASYDLTIVATNKVPQSPYRGMGPPPHNLALEQMMDIAARGMGIDPAEIRRRNFIPADTFPYTIASGNEYDSGNYAATLDKLLHNAGYEQLRAEQEEARKQGRLVGIGVVSTIEPGVWNANVYTMLGPLGGTALPEGATVGIDIFGKVVAKVGFSLEGQGQYTIVAQLLADYFGMEPSDVRVIHQDSLSAPAHYGPGGSRLGVAITGAVLGAAERVKEKLIKVAARLMEANPADMELMDGFVRIKGVPGAQMSIADLAGTMLTRSDLLPPDVEPSPEATYVWTAPNRNMPDEEGRVRSYLTAANACHLVMVEIDRETAQVEILKYYIVDDCGTRLNPAIVEGMTQGAVAQGTAAALLEEYVYDDEGQILTASFMDYLLPTIYEVPMTHKDATTTPSPFTPLGAKGSGESAMHTTPAAIVSAINDALAPLGIRATETPVTPNRLFALLEKARGSA